MWHSWQVWIAALAEFVLVRAVLPLQIGGLLEVAAHLVALRIEDRQVDCMATAAELGRLDVLAVHRLHSQCRDHGQCCRVLEGAEDPAYAVAVRAGRRDVELAGHGFLDGFALVHDLVAHHARYAVTRHRAVLVVGIGRIGDLDDVPCEVVARAVHVELALAHDAMAAEAEVLDRLGQVAAIVDRDFALQLGVEIGSRPARPIMDQFHSP